MNTRRYLTAVIGAFALATSVLSVHGGAASAATLAHAPRTTNYSFQSIASPKDPTFTQLLGINDHNLIAGYFGSGQVVSGTIHPNKGFTLTLPANFLDETYPNSMQTQVIGVNNKDSTDGFYIDQAGNTHGFTDVNNVFTTVDLPGTTFNQLLSLNDWGQAAGFFQDAQGQNHAYVLERDGSFLVPPIPNSQATGINDAGVVIGFTQPTTTTADGFIWHGGTPRTLDYPGSTFTQPLGENNEGQIVGTYNDAQGNAHGFVYRYGHFQTVDVPGASATTINGINDQGRIVGFFTDANGNTVGFVGKPM